MSKVVKKIGRTVKKVVDGIGDFVSNVWDKVSDNPLLKSVAIAAAVYFTGGAALGAVGGFSAGGLSGALQGAMTGISSAWGGITSAGGALFSGQGFGAAGEALAGGLAGAQGAGFNAALGTAAPVAGSTAGTTGLVGPASLAPEGGGVLSSAAPTAASAAPSAAGGMAGSAAQAATQAPAVTPLGGNTGFTPIDQPLPPLGSDAALGQSVADTFKTPGLLNSVVPANAASPGWLASAWDSLGPYGKGATMLGIGQAGQGYFTAKAQEEAERDALNRYNKNVGARIDLSKYYRS